MTQFLINHFVNADPQNDSAAFHSQLGKLAGTTGILCNLLLFLGKLLVGLMSGSIAILADAVNNLSDAASSIVTLLGFHMAQRPADKDHPFGHARYEYLSGMVIAAMILLAGAELAKTSVHKILHPEKIAFSISLLAVLGGSILVKLWMSLFYRRTGRMIHSTTLEAAAMDSRNDVIATTAVLISCLVDRVFHLPADGFTGLAVAVFILWSGIQIGRDTVSPLLGPQADASMVEDITKLVMSHELILGVHDLLIHDYGPGQCFASLHAEISADVDTLQSHDILDDIECDVLNQLNVHLVIHCDPVLTDDPQWRSLRCKVNQIIADMDPRLSLHDLRLVDAEGQTKLAFDLAVPYDAALDETTLEAAISNSIRRAGIEYETMIHIDRKDG